MAYQPTLDHALEVDTDNFKPSLESIPDEETTGKNQRSSFLEFAKGIPIGAAELGRGGVNLARQLVPATYKALQSTPVKAFSQIPLLGTPVKAFQQTIGQLPPEAVEQIGQPITRKQLGIPEPSTTAEKVGEFAGGILPTLALPEAQLLKAPKAIESALAGSSKAIQNTGKLLGIAGKNALIGAGLAPFFQPDEQFPQSMTTGAVLGGIGGPAIAGLTKVPGLLTNLKKLGGTFTPEQIQEAVSQAPEGRLPLGEAIGSPSLKQFQTVLGKIPFSGMATEYQNLGTALTKPVQNVIDKYEDNIQTNAPDDVVNYLKDLHTQNTEIHKNNYNEINQIAKEEKAKLSYKNYRKVYNEVKKQIEEGKIEAPEGEFLKTSSQKNVENFVKAIGKKPETGTFERGALTDAALNNFLGDWNNDRASRAVISKFKQALDKDYEESAKKSGSKKLYDSWKNAKSFYKENVAPLRKKNSLGDYVLGEKAPSQIAQNFIKTGKSENPEKLSELTNFLPEEKKQVLAHNFLTGGKTLRTPTELNKAMQEYNRIGPRTQDLLFSPTDQKTFDDALATSKRLGAQKNQLFIPKTGEQTAIVKGLEKFLTGAGAATAGFASLPLALKGAAALSTPRIAKAAIMSPRVRQMAMRAAAKESKRASPNDKIRGSKLIAALLASLNKSNGE